MDERRDDQDASDDASAVGRGRPPLRWWQAGLIWLVALGGPAAVWFGGLALLTGQMSDTVGPEECEGLGFGCTLSDRDGLQLVGTAFGMPIVSVATALTAVIAAAVTTRGRQSEGARVLKLVVLVLAVLVITRRL